LESVDLEDREGNEIIILRRIFARKWDGYNWLRIM